MLVRKFSLCYPEGVFKKQLVIGAITAIAFVVIAVFTLDYAVNKGFQGQASKEQKNTPITLTPTPTSLQTLPKKDEAQDWLIFTNRKYKYTFKHPQGSSVGSNQFVTDAEDAFSVYLSGNQTNYNVEVQDPEMYSNSPAIIRTKELPLKEFAQEIWRQNNEDTNPYIKNKEVGQILQTTVSGKEAYQFTLTGSYHDGLGGYVLEKKYNYLFVENNGLNFMIWLPADNSTARTILESFKFISQ